MSRIKATLKNGNASLTCKVCGKPIVKSNKYGMYCENMCGLEEDKKAYIKTNKIIDKFFKKFVNE